MATVGDLFDELNGESSTPEYDNTQLVESKPDQIIAYDANNQKVIIENTTYLKTSLEFCERIVIAAYNVAEYVPDLRNDQHLKFWKEDVSIITDTDLTMFMRFCLGHSKFSEKSNTRRQGSYYYYSIICYDSRSWHYHSKSF